MTTVPTSPPAHSLPLWMQITAFAVSAALGVFRAIEFFQKPTLYVHVTRDLFFRFIDAGEALFCSAVLLARSGPILVREVTPVLKRVNRDQSTRVAEKQFPLLVSHHGEKVYGTTVNADHKFFGSSPLHYLEQSKPHRAIYLCLQREYQDKQKKAVSDFVAAVEAFRLANANTTDADAPDLRLKFAELIETQYNAMVSLVQIESGDYELVLTVIYECVGWRFWGARRQVTSSIQFKIDELLLTRWKLDLKKLLSLRGQQIVTEKLGELFFPQLEPIDLVESSL